MEIVKSLSPSLVKFPLPMVTFPLYLLSVLLIFNMFANDLDLDVFLTNPDSLTYKCSSSLFSDRCQKQIVTKDLRFI